MLGLKQVLDSVSVKELDVADLTPGNRAVILLLGRELLDNNAAITQLTQRLEAHEERFANNLKEVHDMYAKVNGEAAVKSRAVLEYKVNVLWTSAMWILTTVGAGSLAYIGYLITSGP